MIVLPILLINAYCQVLKHLMNICSLVETAKANDLESRSYLWFLVDEMCYLDKSPSSAELVHLYPGATEYKSFRKNTRSDISHRIHTVP